jgi:predicted enzyme related to lactoylglutathione lyase
MTAIQPQLWVEQAARAVEFYQAAIGATLTYQVDDGGDIIAQLAVDDAGVLGETAGPELNRFRLGHGLEQRLSGWVARRTAKLGPHQNG